MDILGRFECTNRLSIHRTRLVHTGSALDLLYPSPCAAASPQALHHAEIGDPEGVEKFDMLTTRDGDARLYIDR